MFLTKLIVLNNKSCNSLILEPAKTEPEVLIGINDCGKSTILKSLDVFFDEKKNLSFIREDKDKGDLSNSPLDRIAINKVFQENGYPDFVEYSGDIIAVLCQFELEEDDSKDDQFQDSSKNSHLKWSVDNNQICLLRIFHNPKLEEENLSGYYLLTRDYQDETKYLELWNKIKSDLTVIKKKFNVTNKDVENENNAGPFKNIENIKAIYKKCTPLKKRWTKYNDFSKNNNFFPEFKYLDWNFSLNDLEELATAAMNKVTNPLLQDIKDLASSKQGEAISGVNKEFEKLMGDLKDELPVSIKKISSSVFFNVDQKITDIKLEKENVDGEVHIDNQGDGVKRQIWFALLKWRSKNISSQSKRNRCIWCFDEPETHLYPSAQRQLFNTFRDMCKNEFQILLSTHSTVFIDRTRINNINKVVLNNGYSVITKTKNIDDVFGCLGLQNSDFLFYDKFLAVEGQTEYELIPMLYKLKFGKSLMESSIQLINLKGKSQSNNNKQILEGILSEFQKTDDIIYYLLDSDSGISNGDNVFTVGKYDIEDSISDDIWIELVKDNCDIEITQQFLDDDIRAKMSMDTAKKFHKLLSDYVASNVIDGKYLPSKGSELALMLSKYFTSAEQIPDDINTLFENIKS